jgi:hypothetical protein
VDPIEQEEITENADMLAEGEGAELEAENGEPTPLEDWQKSDEDLEAEAAALEAGDEPGESGEGGDNPKPEKSLKAKKKLQRKLKEADEEKEALRAENERLKAAQAAPAAKPTGRPVRPKELDFDTDEEYEAALDQYDADIFDWRQSERVKQRETTKAQESQATQIKEGVDSHFERAEKLLEESGISPEKYSASNVAVRSAIDSIAPGKGDFITDYLISEMGEGSEKVFYQLGVNATERNKLVTLLTKDPSGVRAAFFLGQKKEQLTKPKRPKSNARPPASSVKGDAPTSSKGAAMKRAYDKAVKSGSGQAMYNAKKEAKAAGIDVSKW